MERRVWPPRKPPSEVCKGNEWEGGEGEWRVNEWREIQLASLTKHVNWNYDCTLYP